MPLATRFSLLLLCVLATSAEEYIRAAKQAEEQLAKEQARLPHRHRQSDEETAEQRHHHRHRRSVASCLREARLEGTVPRWVSEQSCHTSVAFWPVGCLFSTIDYMDSATAIESCFHCCFTHHAREYTKRFATLNETLDDPALKHGRDDPDFYANLIGPVVSPKLGRELSPFLRFLNATSYVTVSTVHSSGSSSFGLLVSLVERQRRPVLITISDVELPRPAGKPDSPPDPATVEALNASVGYWFTTNPGVEAMKHSRVYDFPVGVRSDSTILSAVRRRLDEARSSGSRKAAAAAAAVSTTTTSSDAAVYDDPRPDLLMCCCMSTRMPNREVSRLQLVQNGFECAEIGKERMVAEGDYFEQIARSKFVFSPRGRGAVNRRDLEASFLGAIPLVDARRLDWEDTTDLPRQPSYLWNGTVNEELPVVRVEDWSAVTPRFLEHVWSAFRAYRGRLFEEDTKLREKGSGWVRRVSLLETGGQGTLIGTNVRRLWTPYHLGRTLVALGHCHYGDKRKKKRSGSVGGGGGGGAWSRRRRVASELALAGFDPADKEAVLMHTSPWWCDPGWQGQGKAGRDSSAA
jgi:hypothetical protein